MPDYIWMCMFSFSDTKLWNHLENLNSWSESVALLLQSHAESFIVVNVHECYSTNVKVCDV